MSNDPNVVAGSFTKTVYTVATLPTASLQQGVFQWVSDADTSPWTNSGEIVLGGGAFKARVISDGTNWRLHF